jgi:hypothetical protein
MKLVPVLAPQASLGRPGGKSDPPPIEPEPTLPYINPGVFGLLNPPFSVLMRLGRSLPKFPYESLF